MDEMAGVLIRNSQRHGGELRHQTNFGQEFGHISRALVKGARRLVRRVTGGEEPLVFL